MVKYRYYLLASFLFLGAVFYPIYSQAGEDLLARGGFRGGGGDMRGRGIQEPHHGAEDLHRGGADPYHRGGAETYHRGVEDQHLREPAAGLREPYKAADQRLERENLYNDAVDAAPVYVAPTDDDGDSSQNGSESNGQDQNQSTENNPLFFE